MTINQISIFLENRTGQLAQICRTLADNDISIVTLSLADTTDFGIVRMIVSDHEKAKEVLSAAGHVVKVTPVFAVTVPDRPGGMAEVAPHYQIVLSSTDTLDLFEIKVEVTAEAFSDNIRHMEDLRRRVLEAVKAIIGLTPKIILVEPGSLPRSEGKIKRVIDNRKK